MDSRQQAVSQAVVPSRYGRWGSAFFGMFSLPSIIFGGYLFVCWIRIHTAAVYYTDFPYATASLALIGAGLLGLLVTVYAAWRRSFYGLLFLVPLLLGLGVPLIFPRARPEMHRGWVIDGKVLSGVESSLRAWYESRRKFPVGEAEFLEAMTIGSSTGQHWVSPDYRSRYMQGGKPLPYQIVLSANATGFRLTDLTDRPAVIYYCVSHDLQEFWITATGLQSDVAPATGLKQSGYTPALDWRVSHASGNDYPPTKPSSIPAH
jgi:hypothetical protein